MKLSEIKIGSKVARTGQGQCYRLKDISIVSFDSDNPCGVATLQGCSPLEKVTVLENPYRDEWVVIDDPIKDQGDIVTVDKKTILDSLSAIKNKAFDIRDEAYLINDRINDVLYEINSLKKTIENGK